MWCREGHEVREARHCQPRDTSPLQAIMLSICLQSMVDELMVKKSGSSIRKVKAWSGCLSLQLPMLSLLLHGV